MSPIANTPTDVATSSGRVHHAERPDRRLDVIGGAIIAITVIWALVVGRNLWFFSDEWNIMGTYPSGNLLEPFNGHLSLVPVAAYQAVFHSVGVDYYLPFRLIGLGCFALLGWTTWRYGRSVSSPVVAAIATAAVLWNEGGVTNVLFPFLLNFSVPIAALAAIWWHLDRHTVRHDAMASLWLAVALATSGLGLMVAVAVGVELLWSRATRARLALFAVGPVLWALWYLRYGESESRSGDVAAVARYAVRMLIAGGSSLVGGAKPLGALVCVAIAALVVVCGVRRVLDGRVIGAVLAPVVFAGLTAWSRIGIQPEIPPDELRYRWAVGGFFVLALLAMIAALDLPASLRSAPLPDSFTRVRTTAPLRSVTAAACAVALAVNAVQLHRDGLDWADRVETAAPGLRANLWVAEQAGAAGVVDRSWWMPLSFVRFTAGDYLDAIERIGSPLDPYTAAEIGGPAEQTGPANAAYVDMFGLELVAAPTGAEGCEALSSGDTVTVAFGTAVLLWSELDVEVSLDLFDVAEHAAPIGMLRAGEPARLDLPEATGYSPITSLTLRFTGDVAVARCG